MMHNKTIQKRSLRFLKVKGKVQNNKTRRDKDTWKQKRYLRYV